MGEVSLEMVQKLSQFQGREIKRLRDQLKQLNDLLLEIGSFWHPIETCPKNGQTYLLYERRGWRDIYNIAPARWSEEDQAWIANDNEIMNPSHWMYMPEPP